MNTRRASTLALFFLLPLAAACSGGSTVTDGGNGGGSDGGTSCTPAEEVQCTEHFQCKARSVCEPGRAETICWQSDRGGNGTCTFETLSIPGSGDYASPDLSCYQTPPSPAGPATVRVRGCVEVFGLDNDTSGGLEISIFRQSEGVGGTPVATATSDLQANVGLSGCPNGGAFDTGAENVPTNTSLIVKIHDTTGEFADTYQYGVVVWADRASDTGGLQTIETPVTVIAVSTYQVFPQTAGISAGIDGSDDLTDGVGRGALAGTITGCSRRELANVKVTIDHMDDRRIVDSEAGIEGRLAFTDGNENPDVRRGTTNIDGVYAAINIKPGDRTLTLTATIDGQETEMATYTVPVFADAVTLFSPKGALP